MGKNNLLVQLKKMSNDELLEFASGLRNEPGFPTDMKRESIIDFLASFEKGNATAQDAASGAGSSHGAQLRTEVDPETAAANTAEFERFFAIASIPITPEMILEDIRNTYWNGKPDFPKKD